MKLDDATENNFDVAVIGGGAAGLVAAKIANAFGLKTCIIEKEKIGGCCTWSGCIPSKTLMHIAQMRECLANFPKVGLSLSGHAEVNVQEVLNHVRSVVRKVAENHRPEDLERMGIKIIFGVPHFVGDHNIKVGDANIYAKKIIICIGSEPNIPPIKGLDNINYLTNKEFFALAELPKSLLIVGGGPIGVEIAYAAQILGTKVTIIEMADHILPREDIDLVPFVADKLLAKGADIKVNRRVIEFKQNADGSVIAILEGKAQEQETIAAEKVLVAIGRKPDFSGLELERAHVEYNKSGIEVNKFLQTTNKDIFACGDVVGPYYFSHVAAYQAAICARNAVFKKIVWQKFTDANICWATFTHPEFAHLGLSALDAKKRYSRIKIYKTEYANSDRAYTDEEMAGMVKVIVDKRNRVIGADIVGNISGEIIQGLLVAKANKISLPNLAQTMFIYPTFSELIYKTARKTLIEKKDSPLIKLLLKTFMVKF